MSSNLELFEQLAELAKAYPDRFEEVKKRPEWNVVLAEKRRIELVEAAKQDTAEGFFAYYEGKFGFPPPPQVVRWINKIYVAHANRKGFTVNGYRGSWKSVSLSVTFTEFRIGHEPRKTNLVVSSNGPTADKIVENITETIEFHPWWKQVFPHVVPDKGRWSANGYWVIDNSMTREEWAKLQADTIDPTLVGGGYTSTQINGKHPTGVCVSDDLHGLNNSTSEAERKAVVKFYTTELSKTMVRKEDKFTWALNVGVPWGNDDVHQTLTQSGGYESDTYPVMSRANEGDEGAVYFDGVNQTTGVVYDDIAGWWNLSNPDVFGVEDILFSRGLGKYDFHQMMMMDLKAASQGGLKYNPFPKENIDTSWEAVAGCDPSYTFKERKEFEVKSSAFALAVILIRPWNQGGAIVEGGELLQCTPNAAAGLLAALQSRFLRFKHTAVENVGIGMLFLETMRKINPSLVVVGSDLGGIRLKGEKAGKARDKSTRTRMELAPWLENGTILISTDRSEYLDTLRDGLDNFYELDPHKPDKRWDAIDALYHAVKAVPWVLQRSAVKDELPQVFKQHKTQHPLAGRRLYGR